RVSPPYRVSPLVGWHRRDKRCPCNRRTTMRSLASTIAISIIAIAFTVPAALGATAARTWVSHNGLSSNTMVATPCNPTQRCDPFANPLSVTSAGGEINCLDNGSYGPVTITQSVTIDCGGQLGAIDASGTNGVAVNSATAVVKLRNLTINGNGSANAGV